MTYLVESQHLAGHLAAIIESDAHPEVDLESVCQYLLPTSHPEVSLGVIEGDVRSRPRSNAPCQSTVVNGGAPMR